MLAAETARDSKPCRGDVDAKLLEVLNDIIWLKDRLEIEHSPDVLGFRAAAELAESSARKGCTQPVFEQCTQRRDEN